MGRETQESLRSPTHHTIGDARSTEVLLSELGALYAGYVSGVTRRLPELPVQYADFAAWQRGLVRSGELTGQLDYWRKRLAGATALRLPADRRQSDRPTFAAQTASLAVAAGTVRRLRTLSRGATPFMVALAAYAILLSRWSGQPDLVVATLRRRDQPELESVVGFFLNTFLIRLDLSGDPTFVEVLRHVQERCLEAYANSAVPFETLLEELQPNRTAGQIPLSQTWLVFQPTMRPALGAGLSAEPLPVLRDLTPFAVDLDLREDGERCRGRPLGLAPGAGPYAQLDHHPDAGPVRTKLERLDRSAVEPPAAAREISDDVTGLG